MTSLDQSFKSSVLDVMLDKNLDFGSDESHKKALSYYLKFVKLNKTSRFHFSEILGLSGKLHSFQIHFCLL